MFAQSIHAHGTRQGAFVEINCGAVTRDLAASEMFGYTGGAFTGANPKGNPGKFTLAHQGTIFLDEIGDLPLEAQAFLLRILEERTVVPVGGSKPVPVDIQVIAATNKNLLQEVNAGNFREDLYYRLNVISFTLPPLRKRQTDIPILAHVMIKQLNHLLDLTITGMEEEVIERLKEYRWPGNVRELRNALERAMVMRETGKISIKDLPDYLQIKQPFIRESVRAIQEIEREEIEDALIKMGGNKTKAAQTLGISRSVLYEKLKKHQM